MVKFPYFTFPYSHNEWIILSVLNAHAHMQTHKMCIQKETNAEVTFDPTHKNLI